MYTLLKSHAPGDFQFFLVILLEPYFCYLLQCAVTVTWSTLASRDDGDGRRVARGVKESKRLNKYYSKVFQFQTQAHPWQNHPPPSPRPRHFPVQAHPKFANALFACRDCTRAYVLCFCREFPRESAACRLMRCLGVQITVVSQKG